MSIDTLADEETEAEKGDPLAGSRPRPRAHLGLAPVLAPAPQPRSLLGRLPGDVVRGEAGLGRAYPRSARPVHG